MRAVLPVVAIISIICIGSVSLLPHAGIEGVHENGQTLNFTISDISSIDIRNGSGRVQILAPSTSRNTNPLHVRRLWRIGSDAWPLREELMEDLATFIHKARYLSSTIQAKEKFLESYGIKNESPHVVFRLRDGRVETLHFGAKNPREGVQYVHQKSVNHLLLLNLEAPQIFTLSESELRTPTPIRFHDEDIVEVIVSLQNGEVLHLTREDKEGDADRRWSVDEEVGDELFIRDLFRKMNTLPVPTNISKTLQTGFQKNPSMVWYLRFANSGKSQLSFFEPQEGTAFWQLSLDGGHPEYLVEPGDLARIVPKREILAARRENGNTEETTLIEDKLGEQGQVIRENEK